MLWIGGLAGVGLVGGALAQLTSTKVRTGCGQEVACWHAHDASATFVAYGTPETGAQPLHLECVRGRISLRGYLPERRGELVEDGQRVTVKLSGKGWDREFQAAAACGDGCRFVGEIGRDHPLLRGLTDEQPVTFARNGQTVNVPGQGAAPVVKAFMAACPRA